MQARQRHMPAALDIDREAVRTLVVAVGVREAARQLSIAEATVQAWSARGKWVAEKHQAQAIANAKNLQPTTTKPSQAMANVLDSRKLKSKFNLSTFVVNASKVAARSRSPLSDASRVKDVASIYEKLWPEEQQAGVSIQLGIVGGNMQ